MSSTAVENKITRSQAYGIISAYLDVLTDRNINFEICGSWRRGKTEIGDLDFVITDCAISKLLDVVGDVFPSAVHRSGGSLLSLKVLCYGKEIQVEFITVPKESFGSACLHATGNAQFNIAMRTYCKNKGFDKLNQYGLFKDGHIIASETEEDVFSALGLKVIPAENRADFWKIYKNYKF